MIYVTADLHGNREGFLNLIEKTGLNNADTMYVLGDVIDRGSDSMGLLLDMACRSNVIPLLGNHDYIGCAILSQLLDAEPGDSAKDYLDGTAKKLFGWWMENGGDKSLAEFLRLNKDNREAVLDYLGEFTLVEEVEAGGLRYVLVHAGLQNFSPDRELDNYDLNEVLFEKPDYSKVYFDDKILVTGHTPTVWIDPACEGSVYRRFNHLALDLSFENKIAAVRLDDGAEFYC